MCRTLNRAICLFLVLFFNDSKVQVYSKASFLLLRKSTPLRKQGSLLEVVSFLFETLVRRASRNSLLAWGSSIVSSSLIKLLFFPNFDRFF